MSDQCKHCTVRGDIDKCLKTPCHLRDNWFFEIVLQKQREACWKRVCGFIAEWDQPRAKIACLNAVVEE